MADPGRADRRRPIDPRAGAIRGFCRVAGPVLFLAGLVCTAIAFVDFFKAFGSEDLRMPGKFWLAFVGMPLLAAGGWLTGIGFFGRFARYYAHELTPVATDAFNTAARDAVPGLRDASEALGRGPVEPAATSARCAACGHECDAEAKFCDDCGEPMPPDTRVCTRCDSVNRGDSKYCDECGAALA